MINEKLRELLGEIAEDGLVYDNPSFDNSIIGTADGKVVYALDSMITEMMEDENISYEEAIEFIDYNTLRANPYYENAPIVVENTDLVKETKCS